MSKKIFVVTPDGSDSNSFWRCVGPLSYLAKHSNDEFEIRIQPKQGVRYFWDSIADCDIMFMHRPCTPDALKVMHIARQLGIPVWVDYDDWLFHLPEWNPYCALYHNQQTQEVIASCIACADVVTVTTELLQQEFSKLNPNVVMAPNAYRSDLFSHFRKDKIPPRKDLYYWRGTNTHDGDLISVIDGFRSLTKPTLFMGSPSYVVTSSMNKDLVRKQDHVDPYGFWLMLWQLAPKVLLFPLDGHYFNQCKSNIAWIEALHAGAIVVAPDLPEWRHPGVITYIANNDQSFIQAAEEAMAIPEDKHREIVAEAYSDMKSKYGIETVNEIRLNILRSLLGPSYQRNHREPMDVLTGKWAVSVMTGRPLPRLEA